MKLFKLVLGKETLGFRLSEIPNQEVQLDMSPELAKEVLGCIDSSRLRKGTLIQMHQEGNKFVSDNEENVVEVTTLKECLSYINGVKSSEGILNEEFNNTNEEKKRLREKIKADFAEADKYEFSELEDYISSYEDVKYFVEKLKSSSSGITCKIGGYLYIDSYSSMLKADVHIPNLLEAGKFLHNWYKDLDFIHSNFNINIKNSVGSISSFMKLKLDLKDGYYYPEISKVSTPLSIGDFSVECDVDICLTIFENCSIPGYEQ